MASHLEGGRRENDNLREFHNSIVQTIYTDYLRPGGKLLVMCGGKGGELLKLYHCKPSEVVFVDINEQYIQHAKEVRAAGQYQLSGDPFWTKKIKWVQGDLASTKTYREMIENGSTPLPAYFDVISAQFCMTYFWKSKGIFCNLLEWISTLLKPGGYLIGTVPEDFPIYSLFQDQEAAKDGSSTNKIHKTFKSSLLEITLQHSIPSVLSSKDDEVKDEKEESKQNSSNKMDTSCDDGNDPLFGRLIRFRMNNSIISNSTEEYLVNWSKFVSLAKEFNLRLVSGKPFEVWYKSYGKSNLTAAELQASFLNRSFVFQKF